MDTNTLTLIGSSWAFAALTACGSGSSSSTPPPNSSGDAPPPNTDTVASGVTKALATNVIPSLNNATGLAITDANHNGVRDDIDVLIKAKYMTSAEINAATQYARAAQMEVSSNPPVASDIPKIFAAITASVDCAAAQMGLSGSAAMIAEIRAATANTKERFLAYRETEAAMSGQHAVITDDDPKTFCK